MTLEIIDIYLSAIICVHQTVSIENLSMNSDYHCLYIDFQLLLTILGVHIFCCISSVSILLT